MNLDVERGIKKEKRLIKPTVVMDTNNGFIWVLSKMVHLCFNCYILEGSSCGFGAKIIYFSFILVWFCFYFLDFWKGSMQEINFVVFLGFEFSFDINLNFGNRN